MERAMSSNTPETLSVQLSVRLYQLFLIVYPKSFRLEYGPHMLQVFRDYSIRTYNRRGPSGMLSLWALTLLDLLRSMIEQHLQRETFMSKNMLIRLSGWALVIGGVAFGIGFIFLILSETFGARRGSGVLEGLWVIAVFFGPIGVGLGLLGIRARFGDLAGVLGRNILLIGAIIGTSAVLIGDIMQFATLDANDSGFGVFSAGVFIIFVCLGLYGLLALWQKPQPRWNGLAAVAGFPISLVGVITAVYDGPNTTDPIFTFPFAVLFAIMCAALVMLGYLVQSDIPEQISVEPESA
jgi:hypothetical protein